MTVRCSIDGCHDPVKARGWCGKHYRRWERHGDPTVILQPKHHTTTSAPCALAGCDQPRRHPDRHCADHQDALDLWPLPIPDLPDEPADDWQARATCRDMDGELFYITVPGASSTTGRPTTPHPDAIAACARCPVRGDCLADDLEHASYDRHGLRGGVGEKQRRQMPRRGGIVEPGVPGGPHRCPTGTHREPAESCNRNHRCRCDDCRAETACRSRARRARERLAS